MEITHRRYWITLAIVISSICVPLIVIHTLNSQFRIDLATIGLVVILILPWLLPFIRTTRLSGEAKITLDDVKRLEEVLNQSRILDLSKAISKTQPELQPVRDEIWWSIVEYDPQLALASLRVDIEAILTKLARWLNIWKLEGAEKMLEALRSQEIIGQREADSVREIIHYCNKVVRGGEINKVNARRILDLGDEAISYLDSLFVSHPK